MQFGSHGKHRRQGSLIRGNHIDSILNITPRKKEKSMSELFTGEQGYTTNPMPRILPSLSFTNASLQLVNFMSMRPWI
jgi:hypothetical protein